MVGTVFADRFCVKPRITTSITASIAAMTLVFVVTASAAGAAGIVLAPNRLNFKTENPSQTSASQPVRLWNNGTQSLTITNIVASGDFSETDNCPLTLASGAVCTIQVKFIPSAVGVRSGTRTVNDNASNKPQTASLSGIGGAPALYVATDGNDSWSSMIAEPNAAQTDGPSPRSIMRDPWFGVLS